MNLANSGAADTNFIILRMNLALLCLCPVPPKHYVYHGLGMSQSTTHDRVEHIPSVHWSRQTWGSWKWRGDQRQDCELSCTHERQRSTQFTLAVL